MKFDLNLQCNKKLTLFKLVRYKNTRGEGGECWQKQQSQFIIAIFDDILINDMGFLARHFNFPGYNKLGKGGAMNGLHSTSAARTNIN